MFDATMKLVLGWSVVSAFIVTTAFTLMSLVGWIRFANRKQQQGLYAALVLEVIVGSVAGLRSPTAVAEETKEAGKDEGVLVGRAEGIFQALDLRLSETLDSSAPAKREELLRMIDLVEVPSGTALDARRSALRARVQALPAGTVPPAEIENLRRTDALRLDVGRRVIGGT